MHGRTSAVILNGTGVTNSVKQIGTGGAPSGVWQYTAPAGKKIANAVIVYNAYAYANGMLVYDAKDRSLRLAVSYGMQAYPNWGAWVDYTASIIEATDTFLKFGTYTNPGGSVINVGVDALAIISLY